MTTERSRLGDSLARHYDSRIQFAPPQIEAIAGAILTRQPGCNLLVFGVGYDSALWRDLNASGRTLFVEGSAAWAAEIAARTPGIDIVLFDFTGHTVASSLRAPEAVQRDAAPPPAFLRGTDWDVIVIDGPPGYEDGQPGRALPICWSAALRSEATHIFLHDCERPLEGTFARRLILPRAPYTVVAGSKRGSLLLWSIGCSPAFAAPSASAAPAR